MSRGGKAVVAVLNSGSEATFDLGLPVGSQLDEQPDGAVTVSKFDVGGVSVQAVVEAPWAKDANGKSLPTKYEVKGSKLIQHIDTRGAEYPIVADPSIVEYGWYGLSTPVVYIQWTKGQTRSLNDQVMGQGIYAAITTACGGIPNVLGKAACAALAAYKYNEFKNAVSVAVSKKECLKARVPAMTLPTGSGYDEAIRALWFYDHTC
jgi:hypothetical protein